MTNSECGQCEICASGQTQILEADAATLVLSSPIGAIIAPRRHVARWQNLDKPEQRALIDRIPAVQKAFERDGGIAEVSFVETGPHVHLCIARPLGGDGLLPGLPHDHALISGGGDALHAHLLPWIDRATKIDLAVSFLMASGVRLVIPHLRDLLERGGRLRLLTGDYMDVTEPAALRLVADLIGDRQLRVFRAAQIPFHPKAWIFGFDEGTGAMIVGSSNLSRSALTTGVEWNMRHFDRADAAPLSAARQAFDALLERPETIDLTDAWIDAYEARRPETLPSVAGIAPEPTPDQPRPHEVQAEALRALDATRAKGYGAGLVVLATGLGKTFLAAFDSIAAPRVLFVAHREEILTQAIEAFRAVRPKAHIGRYAGGEKDKDADILFASVQTLARAAHLGQFAPDRFDYIVVDEFHHAAAATYRRIIDHFTPGFLLGLTATPDRSDGGDLLGLCEENLVYECDLWAGIDQKLLSPFHYYGVPDPVEYAQIPWRSGRFDEAALTEAVATQARAENALEQLEKRGGRKAIGFCVSKRHADFMADFARSRGLRAVAVHSGDTSAPRTSALTALEQGALDIVFAVDMFNEGVDVPSIDTVLMLRPTESPVIWLQQLGRGLRRSAEKTHLAVIDYIGNHRIFLTKARTLLRVGAGEGALRMALEAYDAGELAFPDGCEVTYELEALDILKSLIRQPRDGGELVAFYRDFRERHGVRPTASEIQHAGFNPGRTGHAGWFGLVSDMGDFDEDTRAAWTANKAFFDEVETTSLTRSYKMLVLRAMIEGGAMPGRMAITELAKRVARFAQRNPEIRSDLSVDPKDVNAIAALLKKYPLTVWADTPWFRSGPGVFETALQGDGALSVLASELVEWRILRYLQTRAVTYEQPEPAPAFQAAEDRRAFLRGPELWKEYLRDQIAPLFGATFNTGSWNAGIVTIKPKKAMVLLVTMEKGSMSVGGHYADQFASPTRFVWQTQTSTKKTSERGRIISGDEPGWTVHLFLRGSKLRDGRAAPFRYAGPVKFAGWEGEAPITVQWDLAEPLPTHLRDLFGLKL